MTWAAPGTAWSPRQMTPSQSNRTLSTESRSCLTSAPLRRVHFDPDMRSDGTATWNHTFRLSGSPAERLRAIYVWHAASASGYRSANEERWGNLTFLSGTAAPRSLPHRLKGTVPRYWRWPPTPWRSILNYYITLYVVITSSKLKENPIIDDWWKRSTSTLLVYMYINGTKLQCIKTYLLQNSSTGCNLVALI